jgi:hypothetical protein
MALPRFQSAMNLPGACSNCRQRLPAGARFCKRCGARVIASAAAPVATTPPATLPPRYPTAPPRRGTPVFRILLLVGAIVFGIYVFTYMNDHGKAPWDDWMKTWHQPTSTRESVLPPALPLRVAPDPTFAGPSSWGSILTKSWAETALDDNGYFGIRVHALIDPGLAPSLRLSAHLRNADGSPVMSIDSRYRDPNGEASVIVAVPQVTTLKSAMMSLGWAEAAAISARNDFARAASLLKGGGITNEEYELRRQASAAADAQWKQASAQAEVTSFIPLTALTLPQGEVSLQVLACLCDDSNTVVGMCQTTAAFALNRGPITITRVYLDPPSATIAGQRRLSVSFQAADHAYGLQGVVAVRFTDRDGSPVNGRDAFGASSGELRKEGNFEIPSGTDLYTKDDYSLMIPIEQVPPGATAEVSIATFGKGMVVSHRVQFKMPAQ